MEAEGAEPVSGRRLHALDETVHVAVGRDDAPAIGAERDEPASRLRPGGRGLIDLRLHRRHDFLLEIEAKKGVRHLREHAGGGSGWLG